MTEILQTALPPGLWGDPRLGRLPGIQPVPPGAWLMVDDAFAAQMAERDRLIADHRDAVIATCPEAETALDELLDRVLEEVSTLEGFTVRGPEVIRPDGAAVAIDRADQLATLGRLVQEDFCLMQRRGAEHVLTAAVLCFPSSWSLAEKRDRPLTAIHDPVSVYDADVAKRVQRLFDGIGAERPLWRVNVLPYDSPELFAPRTEHRRRARPSAKAPFVRSERQCLVRLPQSDAVVFSIHTFMLRRTALRPDELAVVARLRPETWG